MEPWEEEIYRRRDTNMWVSGFIYGAISIGILMGVVCLGAQSCATAS